MRLNALIFGALTIAAIAVIQAPTASAEAVNTKQENKKVEVVIQKGDSLSKIANKHDTTYHRIFDANEYIKDPDLIYPGDKVRIPAKDEELKKRELPKTAPVRPVEPVQSSRSVYRPAPVAQQTPTSSIQPTGAISASVWDRLAQCESSGNWSINTGNGYYGGLQFSLSSWRAVGGTGYPHQASKSEQIARAEKLQAIQGWGAWPACTAKLGIR